MNQSIIDSEIISIDIDTKDQDVIIDMAEMPRITIYWESWRSLVMKTCQKCGFSLEDDQKFCPKCGAQVEVPVVTEGAAQEFSFLKKKMLGNLTYKRTTTKITVSGNQVAMTQTLNRLFRRERVVEKSFTTLAVEAVRTHTVLDFWDTLYTIIFVVLGFVQPAIFLLAAVCLWTAYGKEMELTLSGGEKVKIPYAGAKEDAETFLALCRK